MNTRQFERMAEVDASIACVLLGLVAETTTVANAQFKAGGKDVYTVGLHANVDKTVYVKDRYGNVTLKTLVAGLTYVGEYSAIWLTTDGASHYVGEIQTFPDLGEVNLIF